MQRKISPDAVIGILLAAGQGSRFDPTGRLNKLLQPLAAGDEVAVAAASNLLATLPRVIAVVRPDSGQLGEKLKETGCEVTVCPDAAAGMGASLAHAIRRTSAAQGWVIALADMPYVQPSTIQAIALAVGKGAGIAAPFAKGRRGNPVGFGRMHLDELLQLHGDEGARQLLGRHPVMTIAVDDPGIFHDIDTPADLQGRV